MNADRRWTDEQVEQTIGNLLRAGLVLATLVVVVGGAIYLAHHGSQPPDYRIFRGEPPALRGIAGIVSESEAGRGRGIVQLGLLLLLATPVLRVAFSVIAFVKQRDGLYVAITLVVLATLLYSILGSH